LNGKIVGETTGFISGILLDFVTGIPFGFNCLFRTIIGYVAGIFAKNVIISGFILPMLCVGIATIAKTLMVELLGVLFPNVHIYIAGIISYDFLFEFIENVLLAPFVFKFLSFFKKSLAIKTIKDAIDND
jgi:rod shape-determining protein MreD